jgi:hypothetical protein
VWRHAEFEALQVVGEALRLQTSGSYALAQLFVLMNSLSACSHFEPAKEQVEAMRRGCACFRHGIERAHLARIVRYVDELASFGLEEMIAQQLLRFRI